MSTKDFFEHGLTFQINYPHWVRRSKNDLISIPEYAEGFMLLRNPQWRAARRKKISKAKKILGLYLTKSKYEQWVKNHKDNDDLGTSTLFTYTPITLYVYHVLNKILRNYPLTCFVKNGMLHIKDLFLKDTYFVKIPQWLIELNRKISEYMFIKDDFSKEEILSYLK